MKTIKKILPFFGGIIIGFLNTLIAAGAGIIAVMLLKRSGLPQKQAQANAIAIMLPVSIFSLIIYFFEGHVNFYDNIFMLITGTAGAITGTALFGKMKAKTARRLLGAFTVYAGIRMLTAT